VRIAVRASTSGSSPTMARVSPYGTDSCAHRPVGAEHASLGAEPAECKLDRARRVVLVKRPDSLQATFGSSAPTRVIETRRHWFTEPVEHHTGGTVNVLNLV
jgi:hypothetical protein